MVHSSEILANIQQFFKRGLVLYAYSGVLYSNLKMKGPFNWKNLLDIVRQKEKKKNQGAGQ